LLERDHHDSRALADHLRAVTVRVLKYVSAQSERVKAFPREHVAAANHIQRILSIRFAARVSAATNRELFRTLTPRATEHARINDGLRFAIRHGLNAS
jgi:hypothetical protein